MMRLRTSAVAFAFGCAAVAGTAAQTQPAQPPAARQPAPRNVSEKITVTGCLQRAEQASTPTTGTTGAEKVAPESFVLINSGSSTSVQGAAGGTTYVLEGTGLASRVGHRVEVKGTATSPATSISAGGAPPPPEPHEAGTVTGGTPGTADSPATTVTPRIRVESVRLLGDCSSSR